MLIWLPDAHRPRLPECGLGRCCGQRVAVRSDATTNRRRRRVQRQTAGGERPRGVFVGTGAPTVRAFREV